MARVPEGKDVTSVGRGWGQYGSQPPASIFCLSFYCHQELRGGSILCPGALCSSKEAVSRHCQALHVKFWHVACLVYLYALESFSSGQNIGFHYFLFLARVSEFGAACSEATAQGDSLKKTDRLFLKISFLRLRVILTGFVEIGYCVFKGITVVWLCRDDCYIFFRLRARFQWNHLEISGCILLKQMTEIERIK